MTLNQNSVFEEFIRLTTLTTEEATKYVGLSVSAMAYMQRLLLREIADEAELELITDATAKKAFYDYTVLCAATPQTFSTRTGSVFARLSEDATVTHAQNLWYNAMAVLPRGLVRDDGFIFEGVIG